MKRFLTLFFIIFYLSSCIKEYDYFTPYVNNSVRYIDQFRSKTLNFNFSNSEKFDYSTESGFKLMIAANSFDDRYKQINISLDYNTTLLDIISNRVQTKLPNGAILSFDKILKIKFRDSNNRIIDIDDNKEILLKVPFTKTTVPVLFHYKNKQWLETTPESTNISKSTWYTNDIDSTLVKGYIIKLKKSGQIALANNLTPEDNIESIKIKLSDGFDVQNSLVLLTIKNTNVNISLVWDTTEKLFKLPEDVILPSNDIVIIVFSEDSNKKTYFGMKYAKVLDGETININLEYKRIEEIKHLINSISM